jgi:arylsulfatase A-like enzyme
VIADPRRQPGRTRSLASSVDLAQTVLELCGLESWIDMQGHSLVPLLDEPKASVRDAVLVEEDFPLARRRGPIPHRARSVITDDGRITRYSSGEGQLFDLATDPDEIRDLWRDPAAADRRAALFERLAVELMAADAMARPEPGPIAEVPGGR